MSDNNVSMLNSKQSFETFFSRADALNKFTLIIVVLPVSPDILNTISEHTLQQNKAAFYVHSIGFYSHFTLQISKAFPIVDTHPDPVSTQDLRLLNPWPELLSYAQEKTQNLQDMDAEQHGHVPYVLLLFHHLEEWKHRNGGKVPDNYKEKAAFRDLVKQGMRTNNAEGGEENHEEAVAAVLKSLNPAVPSSSAKEVLTAPESVELTQQVQSYQIFCLHSH